MIKQYSFLRVGQTSNSQIVCQPHMSFSFYAINFGQQLHQQLQFNWNVYLASSLFFEKEHIDMGFRANNRQWMHIFIKRFQLTGAECSSILQTLPSLWPTAGGHGNFFLVSHGQTVDEIFCCRQLYCESLPSDQNTNINPSAMSHTNLAIIPDVSLM